LSNTLSLQTLFRSKGEVANPTGRPKKWISKLKDKGYKKSEIVDAINVLITMDEEELTEVSLSKDVTVMEKIVSLALLESIRKKTLYNVETLLTRIYGQPKQEIEQQVNITAFKVKFNNDGDNISEGGL
jgi:hypothetical protein